MSTADQVSEPGYPYGRKFAYEQAVANARIEGFEPNAAFTADFAEVAAGRMSDDEFLARLTARLGIDGPTPDNGTAAA
jgi:hypothetical protein